MPRCEEIKEEVEDLLEKLRIDQYAEVQIKEFGDKFCAVDVYFNRPFFRLSFFETIREYLQARGYTVKADIFTRCHEPERPIALRMNVYED